jgi:hypothetical protein
VTRERLPPEKVAFILAFCRQAQAHSASWRVSRIRLSDPAGRPPLVGAGLRGVQCVRRAFAGGAGFFADSPGPPPHPPPPPTPPFISQKPAKQRGKDTEYSFLREFAASSEFSSLRGGGGRPGYRDVFSITSLMHSEPAPPARSQGHRLRPPQVGYRESPLTAAPAGLA